MGKGTTRTVIDRERRAPDSRAMRTHEDVAARDARTVLGNRSARMLLLQPKLVVGASNDALEIEADRVAAEVVRTIAAGPTAAPIDHECGDGCVVHGTARTAARTISRVSDHRCGDGCAIHGSGRVGARTIRRHAGHGHHDHDGVAPIGAAGGDVHAADETAVNRARGGGAALPADFRARVEPVMGADFSGVRVHTGSSSAQLNRSFGASAFTIGNDIFFRDGMPDVSTSQGAHLVSHELTHTIQQGGGATVARCRCGSTTPHVQRHSSFEHLMLGNVKPEDLAKIGAWEDAIEQTTPTRSGLGKKVKGSGEGKSEATFKLSVGGRALTFQKAEILHVLLQEMVRLKQWQRNPPTTPWSEEKDTHQGNPQQLGTDTTFGVVTIGLPQGLLCTYGEMNTLADYFGSVAVLKTADEKHVRQLLQSVREETWMFLTKTFNKVSASLTKAEHANQDFDGIKKTLLDEIVMPDLADGGGFDDAQLFRISGLGGQLELIFGAQQTGAEGKTNKYSPSLGRNACHFVPESWHAWAKNHEDARVLAVASKTATDLANTAQTSLSQPGLSVRQQQRFQRVVTKNKKIAADKANEALLVNGFGDHFLQDSYAAGHMINKTQIMQFYIEYIDQQNDLDYFQDANWRKVQNIAYTQTLAPPAQYDQNLVKGVDSTQQNPNKGMDPQSVENRTDRDWKTNFTALGLQVPPSLRTAGSTTRSIVDWFQGRARAGKTSVKGSRIKEAVQGLSDADARMAVGDLVLDGVLLTSDGVTKRGRMMAGMRDKRVASGGVSTTNKGAGEELEHAKFLKRTFRLRDELTPKKGSAAGNLQEPEIQKGFQAVTYNDYLVFIQSAFLQKATNALHDTFCKHGLVVVDGLNQPVGRVYGDDKMFSANSSAGVAHSGATSQMSRDAILSIITTGVDGGKSQKSIVDRFPKKVHADIRDGDGKITGSSEMPIEDWHNTNNAGNLKDDAFNRIFPKMSWNPKQKLFPAMGSLGKFFTAPPPHNPF